MRGTSGGYWRSWTPTRLRSSGCAYTHTSDANSCIFIHRRHLVYRAELRTAAAPAVVGLLGGSLTAWVPDVVRSFGYAGVALLMLAENLFPPIPSEVILPFTGFLVDRGELRFVPALVVATSGSLAGALVLYALGRWGGRGLILRYGRVLRVREADLDRADDWFDRYGAAVVLFGRVIRGYAASSLSPPDSRRCPSGGSSR